MKHNAIHLVNHNEICRIPYKNAFRTRVRILPIMFLHKNSMSALEAKRLLSLHWDDHSLAWIHPDFPLKQQNGDPCIKDL